MRSTDKFETTIAPRPTISPNDIVIGVMGATGVGKSTFIKHLTAQDVTVGHTLSSCTQHPKDIHCMHPDRSGRNIVFVDTPGFDDSNVSDTDILQRIADWLVAGYHQNIKLTGLLYLHRITDVRMQNSSIKNLELFEKLCGTENLTNVVLVTTFWDAINPQNGKDREAELKSNFWRLQLAEGAQIARFHNTCESGWSIIDLIVQKSPVVPLIAREMVEQKKKLGETSAGIKISAAIAQLAEKHREEMEALQARYDRKLEQMERELQRRKEEEERYHKDLRRIDEDYRRAISEHDDKMARLHSEHKEKLMHEAALREEEARKSRERAEVMARTLEEEREARKSTLEHLNDLKRKLETYVEPKRGCVVG